MQKSSRIGVKSNMQQNEDDLFSSYLENNTVTVEAEEVVEKPAALEGICPRCLDTGFINTVKDGVLGLAYEVSGEDSVGQPIKRLKRCNCGFKPLEY